MKLTLANGNRRQTDGQRTRDRENVAQGSEVIRGQTNRTPSAERKQRTGNWEQQPAAAESFGYRQQDEGKRLRVALADRQTGR